jgi:hypothetical protein
MASPTVVFVHGRAQEFKDPAMLTRQWLAALNAGLTSADEAPLGAGDVVFPFYGDVLYRISAEAAGDRVRLESLPAGEAGPFRPDTPPDVGAMEREMVADMGRLARIEVPPPDVPAADVEATAARTRVRHEGLREHILSWKTARDVLSLLAKRSRVDQLIIQAQLRDVAMYLTRGRDDILEVVRTAIPLDTPLILASHSLGTVVARDLLVDDGIRNRTVLWVTTGSPLGLDAVQRNLLTSGCVHPEIDWVSAYDTNDVVALGHPLRESWGDPLTDVEVENGADSHSISRYLAHSQVAGPIGAAMRDGPS